MYKKINIHLIFTFLSVRSEMYLAIIVKKIINLFCTNPKQIDIVYQRVYNLQKMITKITRTIFLKKNFSDQNTRIHLYPSQLNSPLLNKHFYSSPRTHPSSILILAAGLSTRWQSNGHKQLVIINHQPLIQHALDKASNALVITHHKKLQVYLYAIPSKHQFILETLLSTQTLWKQQTTILLGDVFFHEQDLQKVLDFRGEFAVFGSKSQVEIFALSFSNKSHSQIKKHLLIALQDAYEGGRGNLWEFYHSFVGLPLYKIGFGDHFIELHNTTDIDTIEDYYNLLNGIQPKSYLINHL